MKRKTITFIALTLLFSCCINTENPVPAREQLYSQPKTVQFNYTINGEKASMEYTVYEGLSNYLAGLERTIYCRPICPSNSSIQTRYIDNTPQIEALEAFSEAIDNLSSSPDERRKIAISLVQNIPYDEEAVETDNTIDRYPYQVLYDAKGVCGEKTRLLAYILRHQGYATALLYYHEEKHAALGLRCPVEYSTQNTGYCFIESTIPAIPTFDSGNYPGVGRIESKPEIIQLSNGTQYYPVQDYLDAQEWARLEEEINKSGGYLKQKDFDKWTLLKDKYGIPIE